MLILGRFLVPVGGGFCSRRRQTLGLAGMHAKISSCMAQVLFEELVQTHAILGVPVCICLGHLLRAVACGWADLLCYCGSGYLSNPHAPPTLWTLPIKVLYIPPITSGAPRDLPQFSQSTSPFSQLANDQRQEANFLCALSIFLPRLFSLSFFNLLSPSHPHLLHASCFRPRPPSFSSASSTNHLRARAHPHPRKFCLFTSPSNSRHRLLTHSRLDASPARHLHDHDGHYHETGPAPPGAHGGQRPSPRD